MSAPVRSPLADRVARAVLVSAALLAIATIAVGLIVRSTTGRLGTASPPFVMGWMPAAELPWLVAAVLASFGVVAGGRWFLEARMPTAAVAGALLGTALTVGLLISAARAGTHAWIEPFDLRGGLERGNAINEYLPGLPTLEYGVRVYLDRFAEVVPSQSVNIAGHPPGPLLLAYLLGATTAETMAVLVLAIWATCAPLTYLLARTFELDEPVARLAGLLAACSPGLLLIGVTSWDGAYAAFGTAAALGLSARSARWRAVGAAAFAVGSLMSWALLGAGAWAAIAVWRRDGWRAGFIVAAIAGLAMAVFQGALAAIYGYDPIGTLRATEQVYRDSLARVRPYAYWVFGSPVAWGVMAGVPIIAGALRGAVRGQAPAVALVIIVLVAAIGGFTKAETERIWLFMVPLACVAAAPSLAAWRLRPLLAVLLGQAVLLSVLMNTVW